MQMLGELVNGDRSQFIVTNWGDGSEAFAQTSDSGIGVASMNMV
jgi:hypothetical protein